MLNLIFLRIKSFLKTWNYYITLEDLYSHLRYDDRILFFDLVFTYLYLILFAFLKFNFLSKYLYKWWKVIVLKSKSQIYNDFFVSHILYRYKIQKNRPKNSSKKFKKKENSIRYKSQLKKLNSIAVPET